MQVGFFKDFQDGSYYLDSQIRGALLSNQSMVICLQVFFRRMRRSAVVSTVSTRIQPCIMGDFEAITSWGERCQCSARSSYRLNETPHGIGGEKMA